MSSKRPHGSQTEVPKAGVLKLLLNTLFVLVLSISSQQPCVIMQLSSFMWFIVWVVVPLVNFGAWYVISKSSTLDDQILACGNGGQKLKFSRGRDAAKGLGVHRDNKRDKQQLSAEPCNEEQEQREEEHIGSSSFDTNTKQFKCAGSVDKYMNDIGTGNAQYNGKIHGHEYDFDDGPKGGTGRTLT